MITKLQSTVSAVMMAKLKFGVARLVEGGFRLVHKSRIVNPGTCEILLELAVEVKSSLRYLVLK